jgi:hypothetical protein
MLQVIQLNTLISLLLGDLTNEDRQKIMTICTIDVHSRDVVAKMIATKVENASAFQWQSQLRHRYYSISYQLWPYKQLKLPFRLNCLITVIFFYKNCKAFLPTLTSFDMKEVQLQFKSCLI